MWGTHCGTVAWANIYLEKISPSDTPPRRRGEEIEKKPPQKAQKKRGKPPVRKSSQNSAPTKPSKMKNNLKKGS